MPTLSPIRQNNEASLDFQEIYQEYLGPIYRYVYGKVRNREEAEDLTSQIFLKAMGGIDYNRSRQSTQRWLYLIAQAMIADYWRAHYRQPVSSLDEFLDSGWEGPTQEAPATTSDGAAELVQRILDALPERYREVLHCRFLLNLSIKATAERMGLSVAGVKILQYRALRRAADLEQVVTARYSEAV